MKIETTPHRRRGRPATRKDKHGLPVPVRASRDRALKFFFEDVPSGDLDEAMQLSGDERFYKLHDALHDPAYRNTTPMTLCRTFGISLLDLMNLWIQYKRYLGLIMMANHLPEMMQQVAEESLSREAACPRCDCIRTVAVDDTSQRMCPICKGSGRVRVPGDTGARRLFLEIFGLIGRKAQTIATQQNFV